MVDVAALRALHAVATFGTLARAADELGYTASAISQQVKRLEQQVGVPVLAPAGRGVVLTPAGRAVVDAAGAVFAALEACAEAGRAVADVEPGGLLRVAAFSTAMRGLLAPLLPRLATAYPRLRVELREQDPEEAVRAVDGGSADLAIVHDADGLPITLPVAVHGRELSTDAGDLVVPLGHPLAVVDSPLARRDLAGHSWVTSPPSTVCHQWFRRLVSQLPEEPDVRHVADDFATQLALVASDGVVALVPRLARPPVPSGVVVKQLRRPPTRTVTAVWRRSSDASSAITALLAELTAQASRLD